MTYEKLGKVAQASSARHAFSAPEWILILIAQLLAAPNMCVPLTALYWCLVLLVDVMVHRYCCLVRLFNCFPSLIAWEVFSGTMEATPQIQLESSKSCVINMDCIPWEGPLLAPERQQKAASLILTVWEIAWTTLTKHSKDGFLCLIT